MFFAAVTTEFADGASMRGFVGVLEYRTDAASGDAAECAASVCDTGRRWNALGGEFAADQYVGDYRRGKCGTCGSGSHEQRGDDYYDDPPRNQSGSGWNGVDRRRIAGRSERHVP